MQLLILLPARWIDQSGCFVKTGLDIQAVLFNNCDSCVKDQQFLGIRILVQERGEFTSAVAGICGIS
jgi:hypothetical protein